ncbi:MAG: DUF2007 domain-containing protein [Paludibacter sp.]|nr:DUF2007 domain-containing protein [Paludibacter sp.]
MKDDDNLIRVYSGTEISVTLLKEELEENGIAAMMQNDYQSGITAGFFGGGTTAIDLFVQESDLKASESIVNDFISNYND